MGEVPLEDLGRQSLSREARYMPRTRVHTGRGHSMGEDRPVDPGSSVTGPYFVGPHRWRGQSKGRGLSQRLVLSVN